MRLICPKCNAQYDIANDAIPEGGRDVQCSSCSHTWFQTEKTVAPASAVASAESQDDNATERKASPELAITKRKPLDSSIADILRQEAAREQAAANAAPQDDAGATPPASQKISAEETRRRISVMAAEQDSGTRASIAAAATGAVAAGTNLRTVPSIDEINEKLRARATGADMSGLNDAEQQEAVERRGFRRGFSIVAVLLAVLIAPYFYADQIVEKAPQLADPMDTYVETVDSLRLWLNDQFQTARAMVEGFTGSEEASSTPMEPIAPDTATTAPAADAPAVDTASPEALVAPTE